MSFDNWVFQLVSAAGVPVLIYILASLRKSVERLACVAEEATSELSELKCSVDKVQRYLEN